MTPIRSSILLFTRCVCLLWISTHVGGLLASTDVLSTVPVPLRTQLGQVSTESIQNGASTSIATYQSTLSINETLAFYESIWPNVKNSKLPGRLEAIVGKWLVISRLRDGVNTVIQLDTTETYRSIGFISAMEINSPKHMLTTMHSHSDNRELFTTLSEDGSISSTLSVLQSNQSINWFVNSLLQIRVDGGWTVSSQRQYGNSYIVLMDRQSQRLELVANEDSQGSVVAVINEVTYEK